MKRRQNKLVLNRETLRHLSDQDLKPVAAARAAHSIQSGETHCWCTDTCNACEDDARVVGTR